MSRRSRTVALTPKLPTPMVISATTSRTRTQLPSPLQLSGDAALAVAVDDVADTEEAR